MTSGGARTRRALGVAVVAAALAGASLALAAEPQDPEAACATLDAHRLEMKSEVNVLRPGVEVYTRPSGGERIASCEVRAQGRTIFQRYAGGNTVARGFFLQGKRSGRWAEGNSAAIYAGGALIQQQPATQCDPVAMIGNALTVYCPPETRAADMVADFKAWDAAISPKGLVFEVYSDEPQTPTSDAAHGAVPKDSGVNFAVVQFAGDTVREFLCVPAGEKARRNCLDLLAR